MPLNHGLYREPPSTSGQPITAAGPMVFQYGIWRIFRALADGSFSVDPHELQKAAQLEHHFRTLCQRFVFVLQDLNRFMQELVSGSSLSQPPPIANMRIHFQAECQADHVLSYLNTIIDDVAIVIALATGFSRTHAIDNMGKLLGKARDPKHRDDLALAPIKSLLDELDQPGCWWELGFKQKQGARQLLVHNQHVVAFQLSSAPSHESFEVRAVLMSPFAQNTFACSDFFGLLRDLLSSLFDWLDRLEIALTSHLRAQSASWSPMPTCPGFPLPIGYPAGVTRYDADYFPIPLCNGSDSLPWTVNIVRADAMSPVTINFQ